MRIGKPIWLQEWQKEHGSGIKKLFKEDIEIIKMLYCEQNMSIAEVAKKFNVSYEPMWHFMTANGIKTRTKKEAKKVSGKTMLGLNEWRKDNKSWNNGLTKSDPRVAKNVENSRRSLIRNGTFRGKNNPMYGKVPVHKTGFRKDLGHLVRSSWEANFARILKVMNLKYEYEKHTFILSNGETYTPDFYIPSKNKFYEVKGYDYNSKYKIFLQDYPYQKFTLVNEKLYVKLFKKFASKINIEDKNTFFTKDEIIQEYVKYCQENRYNILKCNVSKFCKCIGISYDTILKLFESAKNFKNIINKSRD